MSQFGSPQRNATQDANEGVVNPPAIKHTASQFTGSRTEIVGGSVAQLGAALGTALGARLTDVALNIDEQRLTDAAIRQGHDSAINSIDATKKRTGWTKAIFGENIEYRAAQQRAAQNAVASAYLEQATSIDDFAGETPEEYATRLKGGLDKILEPYGDDQETRQLVTNTWAVASSKLSNKQYESHYAFNQNQQRKTAQDQTDLAFDVLAVDSSAITTAEQAIQIHKDTAHLFKGSTKSVGMSDQVHWEVLDESIQKNLRTGNIGAFNAAKEFGFYKGISIAKRVTLDTAIRAYDIDFGNKVTLAYEEADLAAESASTMDEATAVYQRLQQQLKVLSLRSSGTNKANLALARAQGDAQQAIQSNYDEQDALLALGVKTAKKDAQTAEKEAEKEVKAAEAKAEKEAKAADIDYGHKVALASEEAELEAASTSDTGEIVAVYQRLHQKLDDLVNSSSGTNKSKLAIARAKSDAQQNIKSEYSKQDALLEADAKTAQKTADALSKSEKAAAKSAEAEAKAAAKAYDIDYGYQVALASEEAKLEVASASTTDEVVAVYQRLQQKLKALELSSSGTNKSSLALARANSSAQQNIRSEYDARDALLEKTAETARKAAIALEKSQKKQHEVLVKALDAAVKKELQYEKDERLKASIRSSNPIDTAAGVNGHMPKPAELEDALDATIVEDISNFIGADEVISTEEATRALLSDLGIAKAIAARVKGKEVHSPLVKRSLETLINGFTGLTNENDLISEQGTVAFQAIAQFAQDDTNFQSMVGNSNYDRYEIIKRGITGGQTSTMVQKDLEAFNANVGKRDIYGSDWRLDEGESKADRITELVSKFTNQTPTHATVAHYMEEYNRALIIGKEDHRYAENYLKTSIYNSGLNYDGRVIVGGKKLNKVTKFAFHQLMNGAQQSVGNSPSLLTPFLATLGVKLEDTDGKTLTNINQVKGLYMYTVDGHDGFFIDSRDAQAPVPITAAHMKRWAKSIDQSNKANLLRQKFNKQREEQWRYNNMSGPNPRNQ